MCWVLNEAVTNFRHATFQLSNLIKQKDAEKQATQTELDDLLMVLADLGEKVARYKVRLVSSFLFSRTTCQCELRG